MESAKPAGVKPAISIKPPPRPANTTRTVKLPPGTLPETGFVRLNQILTVLPMSASTLLAWEKQGRFPASVKLGPRMTVWRASCVRSFMESL